MLANKKCFLLVSSIANIYSQLKSVASNNDSEFMSGWKVQGWSSYDGGWCRDPRISVNGRAECLSWHSWALRVSLSASHTFRCRRKQNNIEVAFFLLQEKFLRKCVKESSSSSPIPGRENVDSQRKVFSTCSPGCFAGVTHAFMLMAAERETRNLCFHKQRENVLK